jgi:protein required for attachment to host cells
MTKLRDEGRTWILVANAARALCYERKGGTLDRELSLVADFQDPFARSKASDLASDRAGYESIGHGQQGSAYEARTDAVTKGHDAFARLLANHLNQGIAANRCAALAILASSPFLGEIKGHLSEQAAKALRQTASKDLLAFAGDELMGRIHHELLVSE